MTSTTLTFTPQGSVCSSMIALELLVYLLPVGQEVVEVLLAEHAARVVWEIWLVARTWFSTSMTLLLGSTTLK